MNKYSEMSDRKINELVAKRYRNYSKKVMQVTVTRPSLISYCDNYTLAFNLMIDNGISLFMHIDGFWCANKAMFTGVTDDYYEINVVSNPCRAIAECYLLMKDAENA